MTNIKLIWDSQKPTGDIIIKTKIDDIPHLNCYAATNHITGQHLFILSVSKTVEIPELKNYRFRGVEIFPIELENTFELNMYLLDNDLKDIFSLFIQDCILLFSSGIVFYSVFCFCPGRGSFYTALCAGHTPGASAY